MPKAQQAASSLRQAVKHRDSIQLRHCKVKTKAKDFSVVADIFPLAPEADRELNLITTQQIASGWVILWATRAVFDHPRNTLRASVVRVRVTGFAPSFQYSNETKPRSALYHVVSVESKEHFVVRPSRLFKNRRDAMHKAYTAIYALISRLGITAYEFYQHEND